MWPNALLLVLLFSPLSGHAEDDYVYTSLRKSLEKLAHADDPLAEVKRPGLQCTDLTKVARCANLSEQVDEDYGNAKATLSRMARDVVSYLHRKEIKSNPMLLSEVRSIAGVVHCMYKKVDDMTVECTTNHGGKVGRQAGHTPFEANAYVAKHRGFTPNLITLGSSYFLYAQEKRAAILIHELSHFCGTEDLEYYLLDNRAPGKLPASPFTRLKREGNPLTGYRFLGDAGSSAVNGDNYALWAINGFCVPKFDCKEY